MLIVCPSCNSHYELDAAKLGTSGRKVRCAACQTLWHVDAAPEMQAFEDAPSSDETKALLDEELSRAAEIADQISEVAAQHHAQQDAEPAPPPPPATRKRGRDGKTTRRAGSSAGRTSGLAWPTAMALSGLLVLGGMAGKRDLVVRAAPQLASVFQAVGLPVNVRGLSLSGIESGLVDDGMGRFLVVEGDVTNIAKGVTGVPLIEVAVKDAGGQTLYTWTTAPPRASLEPAELMRFRARLATPPEAGQTVAVRFASDKPTGVASLH